MRRLDAPSTGCSGSSVVARADAPWSVPWGGNNILTPLRYLSETRVIAFPGRVKSADYWL